jgi:Sec1 family
MHLMTEFEPEKAGSDGVAGPFSGYVPLTVRLVEAGVSPSGWSKLPRIAAHTLLLPPGHAVGERSVSTGTIASDDGGAAPSPPASARAVDSAEPADIDAVVLFVGGVSRAEASAVRVAAAKSGRKVLIAATDVCGANQFVTMT